MFSLQLNESVVAGIPHEWALPDTSVVKISRMIAYAETTTNNNSTQFDTKLKCTLKKKYTTQEKYIIHADCI